MANPQWSAGLVAEPVIEPQIPVFVLEWVSTGAPAGERSHD